MQPLPQVFLRWTPNRSTELSNILDTLGHPLRNFWTKTKSPGHVRSRGDVHLSYVLFIRTFDIRFLAIRTFVCYVLSYIRTLYRTYFIVTYFCPTYFCRTYFLIRTFDITNFSDTYFCPVRTFAPTYFIPYVLYLYVLLSYVLLLTYICHTNISDTNFGP